MTFVIEGGGGEMNIVREVKTGEEISHIKIKKKGEVVAQSKQVLA